MTYACAACDHRSLGTWGLGPSRRWRGERRHQMTALTKVIAALDRGGQPGRELAVRLDLLRSTGVRYAFQRRREEAEVSRIGAAATRAVYRSIWQDAADELGAQLSELHGEFLEIARGGPSTRVWRHWVPLDDAVTMRLALDKLATHQVLSRAGLPVPEHQEFDAQDPAGGREFLERQPDGCVVKPAASASGSGTTAGVRTLAQLVRARVRAARIDRRLLIERQVEGELYRLLFCDGELLDTVRRRSPRVTGDGRTSIRGLIAAENARRLDLARPIAMPILRVDLDCLFALEAAGLELSSVPREGLTVPVKTVASQNRIEDNETVRQAIAPELVAEARLAATEVGLRLAGVDLITTDLGRSLEASGGAIIEVNGTPGLHYHYQVADDANATRVARPILRRLLKQARRDPG